MCRFCLREDKFAIVWHMVKVIVCYGTLMMIIAITITTKITTVLVETMKDNSSRALLCDRSEHSK